MRAVDKGRNRAPQSIGKSPEKLGLLQCYLSIGSYGVSQAINDLFTQCESSLVQMVDGLVHVSQSTIRIVKELKFFPVLTQACRPLLKGMVDGCGICMADVSKP